MTRAKGQGSGVKGRMQHSKGFTLLEVMVAVVIMALVLVSLIGLKNRSMQDVALAEHITTATMLAKRKMVDVIVLKKFLPAEEEGNFSDEEDLKEKGELKEYTWKKAVTKLPLTATSFVNEVRVVVLWKEGEREETVELVSYE